MRASRVVRSISLVVVGLVTGALMTSPVGAHLGNQVSHLWSDHIRPLVKDDFYTQEQSDRRFLRKSSVRKGYFSCPATSWYPEQGDEPYWTAGDKRYSTKYPVSSFFCNATLPHGAKVTSVKFSLHDSASPDYVGCALWRSNLATHGETQMAGVATDTATGDGQYIDTAISRPIVDNEHFTYSLECALFGTTANTGFYGASVAYTMTAAQGAAN